MLLLMLVFLYVFMAFFLNIVASTLKSYKFWQVFYFGLKQAKYLFWNKSAKHIGPESMISGDVSWSGSNTAPSSLKGGKKNMLYIIEDNDTLSHPDSRFLLNLTVNNIFWSLPSRPFKDLTWIPVEWWSIQWL